MKRTEVVKETAKHLFNAEAAIDIALGQTAELVAQMTQIRVKARLSATVGQNAFDAAGAAMAALSQARREIVRTHGELNAVKTRIGCRTVATGGMDKDDEISPANETSSEAASVVAA